MTLLACKHLRRGFSWSIGGGSCREEAATPGAGGNRGKRCPSHCSARPDTIITNSG